MSYEKIPIVVALWNDTGFRHRRHLFGQDTPELRPYWFDNYTSSVGVHPGPNFENDWVVTLYEHPNYLGKQLHLGVGTFPSLPSLGFNDRVSSLKIWRVGKGDWPNMAQPAGPIGAIKPIPMVVELFWDANFAGRRVTILENTAALGSRGESDLYMNDQASSMRVHRGPDFQPGDQISLYRDVNFGGPALTVGEGDYPHLRAHGFNDIASSVRIRR